jgi:two-component system nitrogen regulation sensor histidine kinase NtrY
MGFRFRSDRLIPLTIGLFLGAAVAVYYVLEHAESLNLQLEADRVLLAGLALVMALVVLGLVAVLIRNLIKLLVERRKGVLGSRFRTKLVFIFLGLVLVPSIALFYAATNLIRNVNENLFAEPLEAMTSDSKSLLDAFTQIQRRDCARFAARIAEEVGERRLLDSDRTLELEARSGAWLLENGLDFVALHRSGGSGEAGPRFVRVAPPGETPRLASDDELVRVPEEFLERVLDEGAPHHRLDRLGSAQKASAAAPVRSWASAQIVGVVVVGRYIEPETAQAAERINGAFKEYRKALKKRPELERVYLLLFATLAALVLFAATWTGLYLARQITVPIQALAEGTLAISSGNLEHRVTARAADEIGYLIDSFNRMTDELRSNREAIDSSRRQLESSNRELEERRQYIEQLLEHVPAGVLSLDAEGRITTMNRAAHRLLALDPARPRTGLTPRDVFLDETLRPLVHAIEDLPKNEAVSQVREVELLIEGRPVHLAVNLSTRRDAGGRLQGALVVIEDLTPLFRAQRTAAWREVARRIAHEIKNPLTPIQLSAERILKTFREGAQDYPRIVKEGVSTIVGEVGTLKTLVDEFSRFARMPGVSPAPTDPNAVVESAAALYDGIHPGVTLVKDLEPGLPPASLDAAQLKRALVNLIDNAIAAMEGTGTIALRTRLLPEERILRIEVADDGPGIAAEDKERLFVPYFSTKKRGTGLGLAIVNRIVSDHSGFIRVEDNRPKGARFVIDLPAA